MLEQVLICGDWPQGPGSLSLLQLTPEDAMLTFSLSVGSPGLSLCACLQGLSTPNCGIRSSRSVRSEQASA